MESLNYRIDKPLPAFMEHEGRKYYLSLYFDRVIRFYEMMKDSDQALSRSDKLDIAYDWFVERPKTASPTEKIAVVDRICREHLADPRAKNRENTGKERTAVNFISDSSYIYAAFRQYYGMNLFEQHGKLTWWEFRAMFDCLPADSKIKEIMYIRTRKIPASNGHNAEEILRIKEQQEYYFLPENWEEVQRESEDALSGLFDALVSKAKREAV